jgi:hypothetical protein
MLRQPILLKTLQCKVAKKYDNRTHVKLRHSAFTDNPEHNCHFPVPGRNCTTHRQALQDPPDTSQVSLHKNNKINLLLLQEVLKMTFLWQMRSGVSVNAM